MERLKRLLLWTLEERRNSVELLEVFRIFREQSLISFSDLFTISILWPFYLITMTVTNTRGHSAKITKHRRHLDLWSAVSSSQNVSSTDGIAYHVQDVIDADSLNIFINGLVRFGSDPNRIRHNSWGSFVPMHQCTIPVLHHSVFLAYVIAVLGHSNMTVRLSNHVLHSLLPPLSSASQRYNLRNQTHLLQLPDHTTHLSDKNFITHMLYNKNSSGDEIANVLVNDDIAHT